MPIHRKLLCIPALAGLLTVLYSHGVPKAAISSEDPCVPCHQDLVQSGTLKHPALSFGCLVCHDTVNGKEHPHERGSVLLKKKAPDLCFTCHEEYQFQGNYVHAPVSRGECTSCHTPHASGAGKLLQKKPPDLCFSCHQETKFSREYPGTPRPSQCQ